MCYGLTGPVPLLSNRPPLRLTDRNCIPTRSGFQCIIKPGREMQKHPASVRYQIPHGRLHSLPWTWMNWCDPEKTWRVRSGRIFLSKWTSVKQIVSSVNPLLPPINYMQDYVRIQGSPVIHL